MAREEFKTLPEELARHVKDVVILVEEFPDEETEKAMELETPFDILGLYQGIALPHQSVGDQRRDVDRILLYRRPILDYWCETGEDLGDIIRNTLIHEIGHHFGFSDADMDRLEGEG
ncbi:MAG: metallopeptidase family protein [Alphaproteobacteria bacterium]|nr:metallopeptidase family protein [Alphaproteobacteria bacterium]